MTGMRLKVDAVAPGFHPNTRILSICTANGETVQIETSHKPDADMRIPVGWPVGCRYDGAVLIELPSEVGGGGRHFGAWRVYVPAESLHANP